jgi:hypothetical protein
MDWSQMKERCPCAKFVCRAKLRSHRLAFTLRSCRRRCGVADILRDETKDVCGVVYELLESELENLDKDEDFDPERPDGQNEYSRENCYVWREGDVKQLLLVSIYRGHPQPNRPCPIAITKTLLSQVQGAGSYPRTTSKSSNPSQQAGAGDSQLITHHRPPFTSHFLPPGDFQFGAHCR